MTAARCGKTLMLEGFQAGLSWITILRNARISERPFKNFDPHKVARFNETDIERLMQDAGIIRARAKIEATINGAKIYLDMQKAGEDFSTWAWGLCGGKPVQNESSLPSSSLLSEKSRRP